MLFVGAIFGFFVIPYIADNYGRKLAMRVAWSIGTVALMITCIADSPNMIGLGLFLIGFGTNPAITLCFSFLNEICLGKSRARFGVGVQITWALGETTIALIFLAKLSWLAIAYIMLVLFIVEFVFVFLFIEETAMFMLKKNSEQALAILNKMAKINNR
jgi:OCT family organic cation transporter-like MFS transporter 4/5